jgi:branched-chain amino acid transport system ATP-binding protein
LARIAAEGLRKSFGALAALDDVSLRVEAGEIVGIAGPNGAGKSTLFDVLSGHQDPDAGTVSIEGRDVSRLPAHSRARLGLGRTFQSPIVPNELDVGEVLEAARTAWSPHAPESRIEEARDLLGLRVADDRPAGLLDTLSRRKLLIACLLIREPSVLLLDEPCSGLLADEIEEIEKVIARTRDRTGVTAVVVEHRLELLTAIADRVLVMDQGRVIAEGTPEDVFDSPVVRAAYFGAPTAA